MNFRQTGRKRSFHGVFTMKTILGTACLFFCVVGILSVTLIRSEGNRNMGVRKEIMITAHRGASHNAPENTQASVLLAIVEGADYAEIDVRLTKDGVPVLMHDKALFRTTGVVADINQVTYAELSSYDAGGRYAKKFVGETVPCLQEIFEKYGEKIRFNIELKEENTGTLAEAVVALIEVYGLEESCIVTSAFYEQLEWVKQANEKIKTGYILALVYGEVFGYEAADFFSIKSESITEQTVRRAHDKGKEIHAWTVNKAYEIKRMQELGVDNIITDNPAYVREMLR